MYKIVNKHIDISFENSLSWLTGRSLRKRNSLQIKEFYIRTNTYKYSFFPNASSERNKLPEQIVNSSSVILFKTNLQKYMLENHDSNCKICYNL